jgi:cell division protein FtsQ
MEERRRTTKKKSKTVVRPPKPQKKQQGLSRDEVRSINKKKMLRKRKLKKAILSLALMIVVLCVGIVLVFSLFFKTSIVTIKGDSIYKPEKIVEKSGIVAGDNLFRINEEQISEQLSKQLPYIKSATIKRELPDTIVIEIESATGIACVENNKTYVILDSDGKVLEKGVTELKTPLPVIKNVVPKNVEEGSTIELSNKKRNEALPQILSAIESADLENLTEIDLNNVNDIKIKYDDRITLKIGNLSNVEKKLARGKKAIENENEINAYAEGTLDLKTDPYAFFKAGTEDTTASPVTENVENNNKAEETTAKTD